MTRKQKNKIVNKNHLGERDNLWLYCVFSKHLGYVQTKALPKSFLDNEGDDMYNILSLEYLGFGLPRIVHVSPAATLTCEAIPNMHISQA